MGTSQSSATGSLRPSIAKKSIVAPLLVLPGLTALDITAMNVVLPSIGSNFGSGANESVWILTSYLLAMSIGTLLVAPLVARIGLRRLFMFSLVLFALSSLACGISTTLLQMVASRVGQGLAGACFGPLSQTLLLNIYPKNEHAKANALLGAYAQIGSMLGPSIGGVVADLASWRWIFFLNIPFCIWAFLKLSANLKDEEKESNPARFDTFGFLVVSIAIGSAQLLLDRGQMLGWFTAREIQLEAALCLFSFLALVIWILKRETTIISRDLYKDRGFLIGVFLTVVTGIMIMPMLVLTPLYLQYVAKVGNLATALTMFPRSLGMCLSILASGKLVQKYGARPIALLGGVFLTIGLWWMHNIGPDTSIIEIALQGMLQTSAIGLWTVPAAVIAFSTLSPKLRAEGASMLKLLRGFAMAIGASITVTVLIRSTESASQSLNQPPFIKSGSVISESLGNISVSSQAFLFALNDNIVVQIGLSLAIIAILYRILPKRGAEAGSEE